MSFRVCYKADKVLHLIFSTKEEMCKTMLRFAEHFESPKFRGKIFTLDEFKTWYSKGGEFTYYTDWGGYNIPGYAFKPFKDGLFKELTEAEESVLKVLPETEFYLIATDETGHALRHEIAHAFYYLNKDYSDKVKEILKDAPYINVPMKALIDKGYHSAVLLDEVHAYLIDGIKYFNKITKVRKKLGWLTWIKYWIKSRKLSRLFDATLASSQHIQ
jgi:hypothetical protein